MTLEIAMDQGTANRAALQISFSSRTGEAYFRYDAFGRIVRVADRKECAGTWMLAATMRNGLRVSA